MDLTATLVEFDDIRDRLGLPDFYLFDVRWYLDGRDSYESYRAKHIHSAIFLNVDEHLTLKDMTHPGLGRHPLAKPKDFLNYLASCGVQKDHFLVFYDDQSNSIAARAWWMASALGFNAGLLNGGINSATDQFIEAGNGPSLPSESQQLTFDKLDWDSSLVIDEESLKSLLVDESCILLDARSNERYRGINEITDPKAGHIPGAKNLHWMMNTDEKGRFKQRSEIAENFRSVGISPGSERIVVSSCGSGITACHNIFALLYGLGIRAMLYPPSFSGWCRNLGNPIEL